MRLHQWLKNLGEGCCEIECDRCVAPNKMFYHKFTEPYNHGLIVCPKCGNKQHPKDVAGMYFLLTTDGANYECGNCGKKFIFHDGETESNVQCPACLYRKPTDEMTQEIIVEEQK